MLTEQERRQLAQGAAQWGLLLDGTALDRFDRFASLLADGNRNLNLTRVAPQEFVTLHFLDSLALAAVWKPGPGDRLLDVGTGAGFPGIPLAIAFPRLRITLLDATLKRLAFVDGVLSELDLDHAATLRGRAEEMAGKPDQRQRYDVVTARAVAKLPALAAWLLPLAKRNGLAVAYKSRDAGEEIEAARPSVEKVGGAIERVADVPLPGTDILRKLVLMRKTSASPLRSVRRQIHPPNRDRDP